MNPLGLVISSAVLCALSGIPGLMFRLPLRQGRQMAFGWVAVASALGLWGACTALTGEQHPDLFTIAWTLPAGELLFRLDPLSAFFLLPVYIIFFCVALYGCGYCATSPENRGESLLTFCLGLTGASIVLLLVAAGTITLLVFWEIMALAVFFAMSIDHTRPDVRRAGLHYLAASHVTTLLLVLLSVLLPGDGSTRFPSVGSLPADHPAALAILATALLGFGIKAGIMPLHVWLPAAHANAPSHVSALMSGIVIKMGMYGIFRSVSFFGKPPLWWGVMILCLGIISAIAGVLFAIGQHDIKRLLAYHSIENIGIIVIGIGLALLGASSGNQILFVLGTGGALLHVLNHALFKSLLFLGAGSIIHAAGTREIDKMGGLARFLPVTSSTFMIGAAAICGLPPLNGFVSEFMIYLGMFKGFGTSSGGAAALLALAAPSLALTGGLALACFVKVYGIVFLGTPRSPYQPHHEHPAMNAALLILAALCAAIGLLPFAVARLLEPVIASISTLPGAALPSLQPTAGLYGISLAAGVLLLVVIVITAVYVNLLKSRSTGTTGTWDCGYAAPSATMQYTASSFAQMLVSVFASILRPERHAPQIKELFPADAAFHSHVPEVVLDRGILPFFEAVDQRLSAVRRLQSGQLNRYILYIFLALIILLAISAAL